MKYVIFTLFASFAIVFLNHGKVTSMENGLATWRNIHSVDRIISKKMKIKIGSDTFTATLYDNKVTAAFIVMLPLTLNMTELNRNEKYCQLSTDLPANAADVGTIQEGDLMLWGANTLVLFYKTFKTEYRYTKIGHIDNTSGLASALGSGSVTVSFELD